jgi:hypothetical protein
MEQVPIPREPFKKTAAAARKLLNLITESECHWGLRSSDWLKNKEVAETEIRRVRDAAEKVLQQRRPGRPQMYHRQAVVHKAAEFLQAHSPVKQSTDLNSAFAQFVERFAELVTDSHVEAGSLQHQIRQVVARQNNS